MEFTYEDMVKLDADKIGKDNIKKELTYDEMISNIRNYLNNQVISNDTITAFQFSETLAIAVGKPKEEVIMDIINIK